MIAQSGILSAFVFSRRSGLLIERLNTLITFSELALSVIERSPLDLERLYVDSSPYFSQNSIARYRNYAFLLTMAKKRRP
jgi:hypothetical protein